jgi:hypothetical protein
MASYDIDCLFVHVPKADNHYLPVGDFFNITYMPMGVLALAELMRRSGKRVEVLHLGVEWIEDPAFDLLAAFSGQRIRSIGLPLYWHYQSYDVIEVARALKADHPESFVFLGGITAGYFADQIVAEYPTIDGVLKGHAEGSILALMQALEAGDPLGGVHGLVYVDDSGDVRDNTKIPGLPHPPMPHIDSLVYADLSVMRHPETYASTFGFPLAYGREYSRTDNRNMLSMGRSFFPLFIGRGCPWQCTFCGGNRNTLRKVNGTSKVQWRGHDAVIDDIRRAMDFGYQTMALCFDPTPTRDDYYVTLMERVQKEKLGVDFYFECWGLPTKRFIDTFRRAFPSPESYLAVSPDAGDEAVRKANKQPFYTNAELFQALDHMKDVELSADIFYTIAQPFERLAGARATAAQVDHIAHTYENARRIMTWSVQLEPGSAQFERPADFDMVTDRSRFSDFYRAHGGERADTYSSLGYKINGYFGDERDEGGIQEFERHLMHLKCMEHCFLGRDPRFWNSPADGRAHCFDRRKRLAVGRGTAEPARAIGLDYTYMDAMAEERVLRGERSRYSWLRAP